RRDPVEARKKVAVVAPEPAPGHHEEEVVARLQGPAEPALEAEEPRLAVVLDEVRPGRVRGEVVAEPPRVELRDEVSFRQGRLVALHLEHEGEVPARLQGERGLVLAEPAVVEPSVAEREVDDPRPLRRGVDLRAITVEAVRPGGDRDARPYLEGDVEVL